MDLQEYENGLNEKIEQARELRMNGMNCSECVCRVFADDLDIDPDLLGSLSRGLGGGVAGMQQTCGCITAFALLEGRLNPDADKSSIYQVIRRDAENFDRKNGSTVCYKLKQVLRRPCMALIEDAITLFYRRLNENKI